MSEPNFLDVEIPAVRPGGTRGTLTVRVGRPERDGRPGESTNNAHVCLVQTAGLRDLSRPLSVCGEGPMQALHLALQAVRVHLERAEHDGWQFLCPETGEPHDWRRFWYGDPGGAGLNE